MENTDFQNDVKKEFKAMHKRQDNFESYTKKEFEAIHKRQDNFESYAKKEFEAIHKHQDDFESYTKKEFQAIHKRQDDFETYAKKEFGAIHKRQDDFETYVKGEFRDIRDILGHLQKSTLLIEDYVTNKIPVLFDAYSLNQDNHQNYEHKFKDLESVTDSHSIKLSVLENTSKVHSEQLAKLTS